MSNLEVLLHTGLYEAAQKSYKGWICEINTSRYGDCVNVHLMLKSGKVMSSVGKYQSGMNVDGFCRQILGDLK